MSNITTFDIIAGSASIIGVLLALFHMFRSGILTYKQKKQNAEEEFEKELGRLKAAGTTISARTDLGFFVFLEVASLHKSINVYYYYRSATIVFTNIFLCLLIITQQLGIESFDLQIFLIIFVIGTLINFVVVQIIINRLEKFTHIYEKRVKKVWNKAIDKRLKCLDSA